MKFPALSLLVVLLLSTSARAQLVSEPLPVQLGSEFPSAPEHYNAQNEPQTDGAAILLLQHCPFLIEPLAQSWLAPVKTKRNNDDS